MIHSAFRIAMGSKECSIPIFVEISDKNNLEVTGKKLNEIEFKYVTKQYKDIIDIQTLIEK
jgi:hypothetical protein